MPQKENKNNSRLMQYAGMATQFLVSIGIGVFAGLKLDKWINLKFPLLVWILPLLIIIFTTYTLVKQSSKPDE